MPLTRAIIFTPIARRELLEAQVWYEKEAPGLGRLSRLAVEVAVERISSHPAQFPMVHKNVRRALLRRFPYALMFVIDADESITVIACFHGSRNPSRWKRRT